MAEAATPKRPPWFWPAVAVVVVVLAAGGFAAPSILECSGSSDGFGTCMNTKLADLGLAPKVDEEPAPTSVAVAQPAEEVEMPAADVAAPDFGVRVEPNGSILIAGSGALGKTVEIYVNGELYGTADVDPSGDWVLVPDAPLPPGGYELTLVDPESGTPLDKSYVVAINEDLTSEPLVVASAPGEASEILQGMAAATAPATTVAVADVPEEPVADEPAADEPAADESDMVVASAEDVATAVDTINDDATMPADAEDIASEPPAVAEAEPAAEPDQAVATAEPVEDVVGDLDALENRIDALEALAAPSIDAVEIDNGRNFFAGTGAEGAIVRLYVDNVFVGDTEVEEGHWLLETDDVLQSRSQRVRVDQLMPGTADVASRAEIDFIFEEPAAAPAATAVAEAPIEVPLPDFGIDTDEPVPAEAVAAIEPVAEPVAQDDIVVAEAPIEVPTPDFGIDTDAPVPAEAVVAAEPAVPVEPATTAVAEAEPAADNAASSGGASSTAAASATGVATATGEGSGVAVAVPEPDFSVDTGIPVTIVPEEPGAVADATPVVAEPAPAPAPVEPAQQETVVAETEVPQLVAVPVGAPELGRFATGKAIIRSGDNLWTIARRVYGSGYRYTQIYGANRDQIRDPDLIYPGQVFELPEVVEGMETASN